MNKTSFFAWLEDEEHFKQAAAVLIALVTLLAAVVALAQNDAAARDDRANRLAQQAAIQRVGQNISGETQVNYAQDTAYRTWDELNTLALTAQTNSEEPVERRYRAVQQKIAGLTPYLAAPYFDPSNGQPPDTAKYEADTYLVQATALNERFEARFDTKLAWDEKANTYILHITILAVALFLFGLATTVSSRVRFIFVGTGLLITLITIGWVLIVFFKPVPNLADTAIDAYARGVGLAHQNKYDEALSAYNEALAIAPNYTNALNDRGTAYYNQGKYEPAVADFAAALAIKNNNANIAWDLGWNYYLLGRFDEAATALRRALAANPELVGARFDLGVALLAAGKTDAAKAEYNQAMAEATQQVVKARAAGEEPPESLWTFMEYGSVSLANLTDQLTGNAVAETEAPPKQAIANPEVVLTTAKELFTKLKSLSVALEFTGQPPQGQPTAVISEFSFGQFKTDAEGNQLEDIEVTDAFPFGTNEVLVLFDYSGVKDGQSFIVKVYVNGEEDPSWRVEDKWSLGESGSAHWALSYAYSNVYVLGAGEYTVEMYIDNHLAQRGTFFIEEKK